MLGIETEVLWLATDNLSIGGNVSFTPSEYTSDLEILDPASSEIPATLYPNREQNRKNIKGNQLLQVPELKFTGYGTYSLPLDKGAKLDLSGVYSWTDEVFFHPLRMTERKPMPMVDWICAPLGLTLNRTSSSPRSSTTS